MRVAFRVEGEPEIGLGHVMRCLALAQRLVASGHQVFFFMSPRSEYFCRNRADWVGDILCISNIDNQLEPEWLGKQCTELKVNWLVLDGYQFDQNYRHTLQSDTYNLAVFDDMNNSGALYADLVINGAPNAASHNYQVTAPNALLAIGQDYQVLRQEFLQSVHNEWQERQNLTLMFGGSDPKKLTFSVLQSLQKLSSSIPITVITGAAYDGLQDLVDLIKTSALDITHLHDCQNMASVLVNTKLALSAAGGSQFELLACATPSMLVVVAENQKNASQEAANQGWCKVFNVDDLNADELAMQCISLWQQPGLLGLMHQKALEFPVVDGAKNIVKLMSGQKLTSDHTQ
ncbi:UDP-2,4-diacetamido-2,4,6-trideoxy-beta-L-altropyranose hydrolase [uncultured Paraglaciecola sp.]|uniref:UDP-2,4-diacetamido-2,4, 6-trideoxy-beta-L-altropyranose hydrolase n=1 Tax=uncultured Paraglaciecola sp. TaxID=1765024 RepID=UPI0025D4FC9F|nr:UDP-2,4-diacetamido-2,4,6-trideoxy-beta-L-altropyranose hydrolase [uncultured Paraglaciecola sp.]